ncbi:MAG: metal-dependent hydrolase [Candidatus Bathyarchaeia archaeon]
MGLVFAMIAWAFIPGIKRSGKLIVPLILLLGILPDSDILLGGIGVMHRTFTHSFLFWIIIFVPLFIVFRLKSLPYFVAVVSHFAFGDLIIGKGMVFWPLSSKLVGLGFNMGSIVDVTLEIAGLAIAAGIIMYSGDLRRLLSVDKRNILMLLPLLALIVSALYFDFHLGGVTSLFDYVSSSNLLIILAIGHLILVAFLVASTFQGLRAPKTIEKSPN